jgi:hypothetical protein
MAEAVAVKLTAELAFNRARLAGVISETEGPTTFTVTAEDVVTAPFESVTRAVREVTPVAEGVQLAV